VETSLGAEPVAQGAVATIDLLAGRYALGEVIGRGRSAVHVARDTRLGRDVAVKRVALASGPDEVDDVQARALREARAAARLSSAHVVAVYDVVDECDAVWLVMELVRAPSLEALVRRRGPLAPALAACIGRGVLEALDAAHAVGVVHRDVKPANVLVGTGDGAVDGCPGVTVKLTDFGVAALRDESGLTLPGLVVGSPSYMAPEQASAGDVGPAADLWALGALLYFAQEGVPPYAGDSALATASAVVHGRPRPMGNPGPLTPVIQRLMVKDPAGRLPAAEVRRALEAVSSGAAADPGGRMAYADPGETTVATVAVAGPGTVTGSATLTGVAGRQPGARRHRRRAVLAAAALAAALGALGTQLLGSQPGNPGSAPAQAEPTAVSDTTIAPTPAGAPAPAAQASDAGAPAAPPDEKVAETTTVNEGPGNNGNGNANGQDNGNGSGQLDQAPQTTVPSTTVPAEPEVTTPPPTEPEAPPTTVPTSGEGGPTG
jgi:eukaryotic-like serine/threonine-protein kinase